MRPGGLVRPVPSPSWLIPLVVLSGLALAWLVATASDIWVVAVVGAVVFLILFLQRPDLGLLAALFMRSITDLSVVYLAKPGPETITSSPLNVGLILILVFAGGFFLLSRGVPFLNLPGGLPLTLLLLTGALGLVRAVGVAHSEGFLQGMTQWFRSVSSLVVYGLAAQVFQTPRRIQSVIDVLAAAFVIPAVVGFYQIVTHRGILNSRSTIVQIAGIAQIPGTFVHQNAFGFFLLVILAVFLCQADAHSGTRGRLAMIIVAASGLLLIETFARSAWSGAIVVLLVVGAFRKHVLLILLPLVAILVFLMVPSVAQRLENPFGGSFASRVGIWQTTGPVWMGDTQDNAGALSTFVNRLVGTGPGSVVSLVQRGYGIGNAEHNDYLMALYEYGALGLLFFLATYFAVLISAYRTWRRCTDEKMASIALSFMALTLGFMIMSFTENIFAGTQNQIYFWTLAGLTVAIRKLSVPSENDPFSAGHHVVPVPSGRASFRGFSTDQAPIS